MLGTAIATIVWSMKVIETAKIIAARISLLFLPLFVSMHGGFDGARRFPAAGSVYSRRRMPPIFWIGLGIAGAIFLIGAISGARSRTASLRTGAVMGAYLGIMIAFPLL